MIIKLYGYKSCYYICSDINLGKYEFVEASDLDYVTCGTVLKLVNTRSDVRLHSHDVKYGSGSGQQVSELNCTILLQSYWLTALSFYMLLGLLF